MKKIFLTFILLLFVLPAFLPWMPDGVLQSFHVQHESHHSIIFKHGHNSGDVAQNTSHNIHFGNAAYFNDYLHVDLQNPRQIVLTIPSQNTQDIDFYSDVEVQPKLFYKMASMPSHAPPDWRIAKIDHAPIYLSTQRLRV